MIATQGFVSHLPCYSIKFNQFLSIFQDKCLDLISSPTSHRRLPFLQFRFAHRAELFLFPVQFIERMGVEHNAFVVVAMRKPVNMP